MDGDETRVVASGYRFEGERGPSQLCSPRFFSGVKIGREGKMMGEMKRKNKLTCI